MAIAMMIGWAIPASAQTLYGSVVGQVEDPSGAAIVQAAITETGASSPADMGKVMKIVMAKVAGRAPNDMVSATVRELLQK